MTKAKKRKYAYPHWETVVKGYKRSAKVEHQRGRKVTGRRRPTKRK